MKGKGCLRFFLYTFLLTFANVFIEDFLNIDLDGVTKVVSVLIAAGLIELLIDQFLNTFLEIHKLIFSKKLKIFFILKRKEKKETPFSNLFIINFHG